MTGFCKNLLYDFIFLDIVSFLRREISYAYLWSCLAINKLNDNSMLFLARMFDSAKALAFKNVPTREEVSLTFYFLFGNCLPADYLRKYYCAYECILKIYSSSTCNTIRYCLIVFPMNFKFCMLVTAILTITSSRLKKPFSKHL